MIKFREHRGSLDESLKTVKEFNSEGELLQYVYDLWYDKDKVRIEVIYFTYVGNDTRIDWETWNVVVKYGYYNESNSYEYSTLVAGQATGIRKINDSDLITLDQLTPLLSEIRSLIRKEGLSHKTKYKLMDIFQNPKFMYVIDILFTCVFQTISEIGYKQGKDDSMSKLKHLLQ